MFAIKSIILLFFLPLIKCENQANTEYPQCTQNFTQSDGESIMDIEKYCRSDSCVVKCCKNGEILFRNKTTLSCAKFNDILPTLSDLNYTQVDVYNRDIKKHKKIVGNLKEFVSDNRFVLVHNEKFMDENCTTSVYTTNAFYEFYILEDNSLIMEKPNYFTRFSKHEQLTYCVELIWYQKKKRLGIGYRLLNIKISSDTRDLAFIIVYKRTGLLISCFFMMLVLLVYAALPQLRNIVGMVLMAYTGTLMVAYLIRATWLANSTACKIPSLVYYYTVVSSFFWLNIMSWDVWWTIRGTRKCRPIHRQGELVKFIWYSVYAWGVPIVLTVALYLIDQADLKHKPNIVKPFLEHCFASKYETVLYLYVPILILMVANCVLFVITIYNLIMMRRELRCLHNNSESKKNKKNENRFGVYIKITSLMGISWVIELVTLFADSVPIAVFVLLNTYNMLIGAAIFFIFVFQKEVLIKLCKRFNINRGFVLKLQSEHSTKSTVSENKRRSMRSQSRKDGTELSELKIINTECQ